MKKFPLHALKAVPLFDGLTDNELVSLQTIAHTREMRQGGFFFFQGDPADRVFVLVSGRVRLTQGSADGQQVLLKVVNPPALFGVIAIVRQSEYPLSAQADRDSTALYWSRQDLMETVQDHPSLAMNAMRMMADHVQETQERFRQLATERVERRIARTLLRLARQTERLIPEGVLIDMPLSRQDLAEMNGTTLFTVSRTLSQWETRGIVKCGRERVVITFPHGLVCIAEDLPPGKPGSVPGDSIEFAPAQRGKPFRQVTSKP